MAAVLVVNVFFNGTKAVVLIVNAFFNDAKGCCFYRECF
jgi:hypothetical protein